MCIYVCAITYTNIVRNLPRVAAIHTDSYILCRAQCCSMQMALVMYAPHSHGKITGNQPVENRTNENVIDSYAKQFLRKSAFRPNKTDRQRGRNGFWSGRKDMSRVTMAQSVHFLVK